MKRNWIAISIIALAVLYPAVALSIRHPDWIADSVMVFVDAAIIVSLIIAMAKRAYSSHSWLIPAIVSIQAGDFFLDKMIHKPSDWLTLFEGAVFSVLLLAFIAALWRAKKGPQIPAATA